MLWYVFLVFFMLAVAAPVVLLGAGVAAPDGRVPDFLLGIVFVGTIASYIVIFLVMAYSSFFRS